jgi:hypothetical protein
MNLTSFLLLGLACGVVSYTITKGSIFGPFRLWMIDHSLWLAKLLQCPYCMSHWVGLGAMLVFRPSMIHYGPVWADYLATGFALVGVSVLTAASIFKLFYTKEE